MTASVSKKVKFLSSKIFHMIYSYGGHIKTDR